LGRGVHQRHSLRIGMGNSWKIGSGSEIQTVAWD
jgi:hypothetical protein